ncbi:uncharacterized protein N0V89_010545 [Didymosphaeria variabile]|uniref:Uncharacterized protein n=1 Tax=Didymosphaeria variabile TaxID=1932322 RepID=A0A9W8XBH1_9PLEO|nr:uncharacterized protein N0V89_010545 [Didymosphaeria variabile]KAJ4346614.1 hypothetical protein N0V89_010545 [Didymosphaeria variabile]
MRLAAATTILFTAVALANPAPVAHPEALPEVLSDAPSLAPEVDARAAGLILEAREPKSKTGSGSKNKNTTDSAATTLTSNRMLELGALGLGVLLWV